MKGEKANLTVGSPQECARRGGSAGTSDPQVGLRGKQPTGATKTVADLKTQLRSIRDEDCTKMLTFQFKMFTSHIKRSADHLHLPAQTATMCTFKFDLNTISIVSRYKECILIYQPICR
jgi:hypothetical protein